MTDNADKHVQGFGSKVTGAAALFGGWENSERSQHDDSAMCHQTCSSVGVLNRRATQSQILVT